MLELVSSDSLNVPSEEDVYRAVLSWVKHDVDARRQHVPRVRAARRVGTLYRGGDAVAEGLGMPGLPHVQGYRWGDAGTCLKKDKHIGRQVSERGFQRWDQVCPWVLPATDHGTPAPQLMKCVRLPLLSRDFLLGHVDAESLVRHHPDCKDLLIEALKFHLLPEQRGVLGTSRTRPRRCEGAGPVLFAVGMPSCPAPHVPSLSTHISALCP